MLSKVKVFSKIAQISSRNAILPLNNSGRYFFAASSASNYDAGLETQTGSKPNVFAHPSTRGTQEQTETRTFTQGQGVVNADYVMKLHNQLQNEKSIPAYLKASDYLTERHLGPNDKEINLMLRELQLKSLDDLMKSTIPEKVMDPEPYKHEKGGVPEAVPEKLLLEKLTLLAQKNELYKCYIGGGYYDTITPEVIKRNVLENPNWYTAYTPYQAEISQGRLETLLNYQTLVCELTGLENANSSLLDEGTACAEAMVMSFATSNQKKNIFFVSNNVFPQSLEVLKTRAENAGIKLVVGDPRTFNFASIAEELGGVLLQTPDMYGVLHNYTEMIKQLKGQVDDLTVVIACDPLALTKTVTPGEMGADIAVGSTQRFGVPMGFGGPHAAFMVAKASMVRKIPGRIIGVSKDAFGNRAYRLTLQTREQHIKREKATSNICTAQVLLANISALYAIYHGKQGLEAIAHRVNALTQVLAYQLTTLGYTLRTKDVEYFDTLALNLDKSEVERLLKHFRDHSINLGKIDEQSVRVSLSENTTLDDVRELVSIFAEFKGKKVSNDLFGNVEQIVKKHDSSLQRNNTQYLQQEVFNSIHSEHQMLRYMHMLISKDISLTKSMIPLGSCTMKLNATTEMRTISIPELSLLHPFTPKEQTQGYLELLDILKQMLRSITKFDEFSLQPNSGAQGEYAGLSTIIAYLKSQGQAHRNICLIPQSAHGTNPASAVMCGMKVVVVKSDADGNVDLVDLKAKAEEHKDKLGALMITYPSTHGVYEPGVIEACKIVHKNGGQVYMDGANMNAQVGWTSPAFLGADVCHLNMHKTFCIPHGGGGPGMGPIGVKAHLAPYLPLNSYYDKTAANSGAVSAAPYGSASILPISIAYIWGLGKDGLRKATAVGILAANYMAERLKNHYKILYKGQNGRVAHEFIIDIRPIKAACGVTEEDIAKRLADYGFHAPTVSFPVPGTIMIEPTESEDKAELDRFADSLIKIREEIKKIEDGVWDKKDNPLKNAPHPADHVNASTWDHCYTREEAAYPLPWVKTRGKYWPPVGRVDNAFGDRNLVCTCEPTSDYF
jgi:glycine dehydrogenase